MWAAFKFSLLEQREYHLEDQIAIDYSASELDPSGFRLCHGGDQPAELIL
jgi:hypothetical protein